MIAQRIDKGLEHEHRRHVADQVGEDRRHRAEHRHAIELQAADRGDRITAQQGVLCARDMMKSPANISSSDQSISA